MKRRKVKNVAASIRQRLLNEARASGRPFHEILQYFAMERFLYRLSESPHGEKFVLKGALMLAAWDVSFTRPTMDNDLLGHVTGSPRRPPRRRSGLAGLKLDEGTVFASDRVGSTGSHCCRAAARIH